MNLPVNFYYNQFNKEEGRKNKGKRKRKRKPRRIGEA